MKLIDSSVEFFGEVPTDRESALKFIELAGRTCYKSEDKISDGSAEKFVKKLIDAKPYPHLAMVEHSNFVIRFDGCAMFAGCQGCPENITGKYLTVLQKDCKTYIGGNLTAWYQRSLEFKYGTARAIFHPFIEIYGDLFGLKNSVKDFTDWEICPHNEIPRELHRYAAKFICDRGVSHELVRHRPCSFAQESTRYVNYAGKEMEFIRPSNYDNWGFSSELAFENSCRTAEADYMALIDLGHSPQRARAVLPNSIKTEIVVTTDRAEWQHIFNLRTHVTAHPDMRQLMGKLSAIFDTKGIFNG